MYTSVEFILYNSLILSLVRMVKAVKLAAVYIVSIPWKVVRTISVWLRAVKLLVYMYSLGLFWSLWLSLVNLPGLFHSAFIAPFVRTNDRSATPPCLTDGRYGRHCYMKLKDLKLHYVEAGDDSLPLLVCLHSVPEFWYSWRHQLTQLSKMYWIVAFDLRGFGNSELSHSDSVNSIEEAAKDVVKFLELVGRGSCFVIGHGLGGLVGWKLINNHTEFVKKFVSLSCPHPAIIYKHIHENTASQSHWTRYVYASMFPWLTDKLCLLHDSQLIDSLYKKECYNTDFIQQSDIETFKHVFSKKENWRRILEYMRRFALSNNFGEDQVKSESKTPVLLLFGEQDKIFHKTLYYQTVKFHDNVIHKAVRGSAHWLQQEKPKQVNSLIVEFLEEGRMERYDGMFAESLMKRLFSSRVSASLSNVYNRMSILSGTFISDTYA